MPDPTTSTAASDMLEQWILAKIDSQQSAPLLVLHDPQRMIQPGAQAVDGWAKAHGFAVLFCAGNLALREMYERMRGEPDVRGLLVDRSRSGASTPLFYPDLQVLAGRKRQVMLTLHDFLVEKTGDAAWPLLVNERNLSRLLLPRLPAVLAAHAQLRAVRPSGFSDSDLYSIVLGAALNVNPFRKLNAAEVRSVAMQHHRTLQELAAVLPAGAMQAWRTALAKVDKPFCWLLDHDPQLVIRAFTLAAIMQQHGLNYRLLLSNLDPQLHPYQEIEASFLQQAVADQLTADPARLLQDVADAEQYLQEHQPALTLLLRDQLQLDDPAQAREALRRERLSPLVRAVALLSLLADLITARNLKVHRPIQKLLQEQDGRGDIPALRRPPDTWVTLLDVYRKAFATIELIGKLGAAYKKVIVMPDDQLPFDFFYQLWDTDHINRLDYYLSDLERTLRVGAMLPLPQRSLWPQLERRWQLAREELADTSRQAMQALDVINAKFQDLYVQHYAGWIHSADAPVVFTHQFLERVLKAHWDPKGAHKAVVLVFDGMRSDAFDELLRPVIEERYHLLVCRPGSAILPTETHLSRKAIAAGRLPDQFTASGELDLLKRWLKDTWNLNMQFEVLKDDDTIASGMTVRYNSDTFEYIIFNFSDKNLHNNPGDLAFIYDTTVRNIIQQDVRSVLRELPPDALLFVTSDHGFTPVPKQALHVDAAWFAAAENVNYRVGRTSRQVPEQSRAALVSLDARTLGIPLTTAAAPKTPVHSVIFPRPGHTLQRPGCAFRPDRYTHGGLSMAECLVPVAVFGPRQALDPVLYIDRFVQTSLGREGEPVTLEITLIPMRSTDNERVVTFTFSDSALGERREFFSGAPRTYTVAWTPPPKELSEAERASGEVVLPVTLVVAYQEGGQIVRSSRSTNVRIKVDTERLRRRVDSKLDLLMGKVPKGLQG